MFSFCNNSIREKFVLIFLTAAIALPVFVLSSVTLAAENPLAPFVIQTGDIDDYTLTIEAAYYRPESLWNYINGGALPYLDFGVGDVVSFSGKIANGAEIVTDIYDMTDNLGAFGIYSNERFPDYDYREIGVEGYVSESAVCFWKGHYYVKIFSNESTSPSQDTMLAIANEIAGRIPEGGVMSPYFKLLPEKDRLPKSESYAAKNVLGQDFLTRGFNAHYKDGDTEYQFHIIECENGSDASVKFKQYKAFIAEFGKIERKKAKLGEEAFVGNEDWYGLMVFARKGRFIVGSVGMPDLKEAKKALGNMLEGL